MCGRFSIFIPLPDLIKYFRLEKWLEYEDRYNVAPSQSVPVVRQSEESRTLAMLHWGLIPHWAKDKSIGYKMINARAETVDTKPSFRTPFHQRRCVVPASGFYEWKKSGTEKQPYYIFRQDRRPMALAGLWDRWENPEKPGEVVESCTIITTEANDQVALLHNRMPAILEREDVDLWLGDHQRSEELLGLLRPAADGVVDLYPVSTYVNKPGHEGKKCIEAKG